MSAEAASSQVDFRGVIAAIAFELSVARAKSLSQSLDFIPQTPDIFPNTEGVYAVYCVLTGKATRLTFRVCVDELTARAIVSASTGRPFEEVTPESGFDFVKELANLVSGGIQKHLQDQGIALGIGLPLVVPGDKPTPSIFKKTPFDYVWLVSSGECHLSCALGINVTQAKLLEHLAVPDFAAAEAAAGDVDFL